MMLWASALMLGIAGSLHCAGMCGPIALALPRSPRQTPIGLWTGRLLYNLGRVITYALMGALIGALGQSFILAGWQRGLSLACGAIILIYLLARLLGRGRVPVDSLLLRAVAPIQRALGQRLGGGSPYSLFTIGLLNGLLPCGLVYVALAAAAATGTPLHGALFMALFGFGTAPLLFAIALAGPALQARSRGRLGGLIPASLVLLAVLFILRGLDLGIPYISPRLPDRAGGGAPHACCSGHVSEPE